MSSSARCSTASPKQDTVPPFSRDELLDAATQGIIDDKVIALGGVDAGSISVRCGTWVFGVCSRLG